MTNEERAVLDAIDRLPWIVMSYLGLSARENVMMPVQLARPAYEDLATKVTAWRKSRKPEPKWGVYELGIAGPEGIFLHINASPGYPDYRGVVIDLLNKADPA